MPLTSPLTDMEPATRHTATQESFFEDQASFPTLEAYEAVEEGSHESFHEPEEDYSEEMTEPASVTSESPTATVRAYEPQSEPQPEAQPAAPTPAASADSEPSSDSGTVLTVDDFAALEERILRAVNLVRHERHARAAAEERVAVLETQLHVQSPAVERLQKEVESLRIEREQVRQRVERLLSQLEALEL